jgi:hypothetical protein
MILITDKLFKRYITIAGNTFFEQDEAADDKPDYRSEYRITKSISLTFYLFGEREDYTESRKASYSICFDSQASLDSFLSELTNTVNIGGGSIDLGPYDATILD